MSESTQFKRTDKAIVNALMELLKEKSFEKITVQDILDATPVTRSTFYKHFHDKYEIAEKLQEYFLSSQYEIRKDLLANPSSPQLQKAFRTNYKLMNALLNIHTEKVDIREGLAHQAELYYLESHNSPTSEIEAQVYAHALTAFQLAIDYQEDFSFSYMDDIFISAFLMLLGLPQDEDIAKLVHKKLVEKHKRLKEQKAQ